MPRAGNCRRRSPPYEAALRQLCPATPDVLVQLSYLHSLSGHYRLGRDYALRRPRTGTTSPKVLVELVPRLRTFNADPGTAGVHRTPAARFRDSRFRC